MEVDRRHQRRRRRLVQSRLTGRDRRRADRRRRGLRRGGERHPGTHARLRGEIAALADRSTSRPAEPRARRGKGLRAVGSLQYARHPRIAHPRLPHVRQLPGQSERARGPLGQGSPFGGALQLRPAEPSAGHLQAGGRQDRAAHARGTKIHRRSWPQRTSRSGGRRHRTDRAGRSVQCAQRPPGRRGPQRCRRQHAPADAVPQRGASARAGGNHPFLRGQARRARRRRGGTGLSRAGDRADPAQGRSQCRPARQGPVADGRRIHAPRRWQGARRLLPPLRHRRGGPRRLDRAGRSAKGRS